MPTPNENVEEAMKRGAARALKESGYSSREELLKEAADLGFIDPNPGSNPRPQ